VIYLFFMWILDLSCNNLESASVTVV